MESVLQVSSEIGVLKKVIIHKPGPEVKEVTPINSEELLYNDIIDLQGAIEQHNELTGILSKVCKTYEVKDLLTKILENKSIKKELITTLVNLSSCKDVYGKLITLSSDELAQRLISGTRKKIDSLTKYLSKSQYALPPIPNLFFTRDSTMVVDNKIIIGSMANKVRLAESVIMKYIFEYHPELKNQGFILDGTTVRYPERFTIEGGDVHILRKDTIVIGMSERTSPYGIDYLANQLNKYSTIKNIFVVTLPKNRAFIHLDMIFSMIDIDKCVIYPSLIIGSERLEVIHMKYKDNKEIESIYPVDNLITGLESVGIKLNPIFCGGSKRKNQDREQWQSGANFFAIGPGKMIGYERNDYTLIELEKAGIPIVGAKDVLKGKIDISKMEKYAIGINSSELMRGGGGCRCMTQPILREEI